MRLKRWICLVAALAVFFSVTAHAAEGNRNLVRNSSVFQELSDYPRSGCVAGDVLYICGYNHIYSYRLGEDMPSAAAFELPPAEENEARELVRLFANGDQLCALLCVYRNAEDEYGPVRLEIAEVMIDGGEARFGEPVEAEVDALTVDYGSASEFVEVYNAVCVEGILFLRVINDAWMYKIYAMDLESGAGRFLDVENPRNMTAWKDGGLLIESYDSNAGRLELLIYDIAADRLTPACAPMQADEPLSGLICSRESGRLFYMENGYVMAVSDFDFSSAQPVAELFVRYADEAESMLLPGDYYVCCGYYDGALIRSTDTDGMPRTRITVQSAGIDEVQMNAYYDFNSAHEDAAAVLKENYAEGGTIIEAMMNRDPSVDIYILSVNSEAYDALYHRGYMAALNDAEIAAAVQGMYPAIQDAITRDGEIVAVPVMLYGWTLGLDYDGFEKIGISREEIPTDWTGFLELLDEVSGLLPEDGSVRVFEDWYTQKQARMELLDAILDSWHLQLNASGEEVRYDVPELTEALRRVMALDLDAMGMPEGDEDDAYTMITVVGVGGDRNYTLVAPSAGCTIGDMGYNEPALLSVIPGERTPVPLGMAVAVVNPFSRNADLAQEYLKNLYQNLGKRARYNLNAELNEPVTNRYYQQNLENTQRELESAQEALAAADAVDVPMWEDRIALLEEEIANIEAYGWEISPRDIAWFRAHDSQLFVSRYNYVDVAYGNNEFDALIQQFLAGRMDADAFLKELDRRVQMKAREGN